MRSKDLGVSKIHRFASPNPDRQMTARMTRRRLIVIASLAMICGIGWWCMSDGKSQLQRDVEAIGGEYKVRPSRLLAPSKYDIVSFRVRRMLLMTKPDPVSLDFSNSNLNDQWIEEHIRLLNHRTITDVSLANTAVTDQGIAKIAYVESIEILDLSNTNITDQSISLIDSLPHLFSIKIAGTNITELGLVELLDKPSLLFVDFDAKLMGRIVVDKFNARPKFDSLFFDKIDAAQLARLSSLKYVVSLHLSGLTEAEVPVLCNLTSLQFLIIKDSTLSSESIEFLKSKLTNTDVYEYSQDNSASDE